MGFLDKLKGTAKQAVSPGAQMGERNKIQRINEVGVEHPATVNSMREVGTSLGGGHDIEFELTVKPAGAEPYQVATKLTIFEQALPHINEGSEIIVKVDPEDPQSLLYWGNPT